MPIDLSRKRVLPVLRRNPTWAGEAHAAWDFLTANGTSPRVTLHRLLYFLWYLLPVKLADDTEEARRVALALAQLLEAIGHGGAGAISRGPVTMHVLAEWDEGPTRGRRGLKQALDASGVEPPNTSLITWGVLLGPTEVAVMDSASLALEEAISEHRFTPGTAGWRRPQVEVLDQFLSTPNPAFEDRTPLEAVWGERQESWAEPPARPLRQALLSGVRDKIRRLPAPPLTGIRDHLRPLAQLLDLAGSHPRLTAAGYLPPLMVREFAQEFGWHESGAPPRSEVDVPQVVALRTWRTGQGLSARKTVVSRPPPRRASDDRADRAVGQCHRRPRRRRSIHGRVAGAPAGGAPGWTARASPRGLGGLAGARGGRLETQRPAAAHSGHGVLLSLGRDPADGPARHDRGRRLAGLHIDPDGVRNGCGTRHSLAPVDRAREVGVVLPADGLVVRVKGITAAERPHRPGRALDRITGNVPS